MSKRLLLGIDIGTSACKVAAFDLEGQVVGAYSRAYQILYPCNDGAEHDAGAWWDAVCYSTKALIESRAVDPKEIAAVGIDGLSWVCLPVDRTGMPLRRAMIWLDRRAQRESHWMKERVGEELLVRTSGNPVDPAYCVPKILWVKHHEPDVYRRTDKFLQSNSYIVLKLTGEYSQDRSQGYGLHLFDIANGCYSESIADQLGISLDLLAPIYGCHEVVGTVTSQASRECGIPEGVPVVAGGLDAACSTLSAGVLRTGQAQEQGGQAGGMSILVERPLVHRKLILGYHVVPDKWLLQGGTVGGGGTLRWFNEQLGAYEQQVSSERGLSAYEVMSEEAARVRPGSDGLVFLPYMSGERSPIWDSTARGVLFGLSYDKTRAHIIRAIMEGVGYSLLHNLATAEEVGANACELVSVGGSANSTVWTQLKSDITGRPISVPYSDHAAALGSAMLAGIGIGVYKDFESAVSQTVRIRRVHVPSEENHKIYEGYYKLYLDLYRALRQCYERLSVLGG